MCRASWWKKGKCSWLPIYPRYFPFVPNPKMTHIFVQYLCCLIVPPLNGRGDNPIYIYIYIYHSVLYLNMAMVQKQLNLQTCWMRKLQTWNSLTNRNLQLVNPRLGNSTLASTSFSTNLRRNTIPAIIQRLLLGWHATSPLYMEKLPGFAKGIAKIVYQLVRKISSINPTYRFRILSK